MKNKFIILLILISCNFCFGYSRVFSGEKNLKMVKTQYFDIIYPEKSKQTASVIINNCDSLYEELSNLYKLKYKIRFTVVITRSTDLHNAYFSTFPYNHIVLYDTLPSKNLLVFDNTILDVFKHELTHGFTINLKNKPSHTLSNIFGQVINPTYLITTPGIMEGTAVLEESRNGQGRLNNEFAKHQVKQAVLEEDFLKYTQVTGARDINPNDVFYNFNSEFFLYLEKKYGHEKIAKFWYECSNLGGFTYFTIFKKVFNNSFSFEWNEFYKTKQDELKNIKKNKIDSEKILKKENLDFYSHLITTSNKIFYYNDTNSSIYVLDYNLEKNEYKKPKKLICQNNIYSVSLCNKEKYLFISYYDSNSYDYKLKGMILDLETNKRFYIKQNGIQYGKIFYGDNKPYFALIKSEGQYSNLYIYEVVLKKNKISNLLLKEVIYSDFAEINLDLSCDNTGSLIFLKKKNLNYYVCKYNFFNKEKKLFKLPKEIAARDLSINKNNDICFSYVKDGSMSDFAVAKINNEKLELKLYNTNISGGIFNPYYIDEKIFYIGKFFKGDNLFVCSCNEKNYQNLIIPLEKETKELLSNVQEEKINIENEKTFNPYFYFKKSLFLPFSIARSYRIKDNLLNFDSMLYPLGVTFATSTPWDMPIFISSFGFSPRTKSFLFDLYNIGGTKTSLFNYLLNSTMELDQQGFKQTKNLIQVSSTLDLKNNFYLSLNEELNIFYGRQNKSFIPFYDFKNLTKNISSTDFNLLYGNNNSTISLGNKITTGKGINQFLGASVFANTQNFYISNLERISSFINVLYTGMNLYLPCLNPLKNTETQTINWPSTISFAFNAFDLELFQFNVKTILYEVELQNVVNWMPILYFNRMYSLLTYNSWGTFNKDYYFNIELSLNLALALNIGYFAKSSMVQTFGIGFSYTNYNIQQKNPFQIKFYGITLF